MAIATLVATFARRISVPAPAMLVVAGVAAALSIPLLDNAGQPLPGRDLALV